MTLHIRNGGISVTRNPFFNQSGYPDPTAYHGTKEIVREEERIEKELHDLLHIIRAVCNLSGFEVVGRITFRHKKTGKEFK